MSSIIATMDLPVAGTPEDLAKAQAIPGPTSVAFANGDMQLVFQLPGSDEIVEDVRVSKMIVKKIAMAFPGIHVKWSSHVKV
jgi:hypothetical protein